jgi:hypothetical protein
MTELFARDLPPGISTDENARRVAELQLSQKAALDPELLGPCLQYLRAAFSSPPDTARRQLLRLLNAEAGARTAERNTWIRGRVASLDAMELPPRVHDAAASYLEEGLAPVYGDTGRGDPDARADYAVVKWYRRDPSMSFDPSADYRGARRAEEAARRERLYGAAGGIETLSPSGRDDLVRSVLNDWRLFRDDPAGLDPAEVVVRASRANTAHAGRNALSFTPYYTIRNDAFAVDEAVTIQGLQGSIPFDWGPDLAQSAGALGYRFAFSGDGNLFSSVTLAVGYARETTRPVLDRPGVFVNSYIVAAERHTETVNMQVNQIAITSARSLHVEARTPLVRFGRRLSIEGGIHVSQNVLEYDHAYQYRWTHVIVYPIIGGTYTETRVGAIRERVEHKTERSTLVRPAIAVFYDVADVLAVWAGTTVVTASAGLSLRW